ncbi:MAG: N-6 DNA methylase [Ignavibacteriales bacterium]|nr:N-6 DNA methylase [Ignavibacteriales bacterium]
MSEQYEILLNNIAASAGWQFGLVTKKDFESNSSSLTPDKKEFASNVFANEEMQLDAIYFSGNNPFIYFKQLSKFNPTEVRKLHQKIWNLGRIPLLAIITPLETRLYDCFDTPVRKDEEIKSLKDGYFQNNVEDDLRRLGELLHQSKIDSGVIWEKDQLGHQIKTANRVDRKLVENLKRTREKLKNNYHLPLDVIHDLLGRSLFTLYLEDRGVLIPEVYPTRPDDVENFFDLLNHPKATYDLFHFLKDRFNGDLFPVSPEEEKLLKNNRPCLEAIKDCFTDNVEQLSFPWRLFQFQYIPIELISSIYEEFMSGENESHSQLIKEKGAYYTPQMLVEFVLNEVLPWPDEYNSEYNLKILDPACGSGIFLVESYKRLIARWKYSNKNRNISKDILEQLLLNNIYGIEKDTQAIKVAAFSLYLSYLSYLEPKKILSKVRFKPLVRWSDKRELRQLQGKKPGNNLFQFSTFAKELKLVNNKFDLIVGNPPWKKDKPEADVKEYLDRYHLPAQIMCAYLHYMPALAPNGVTCLISAAKIFFNTGSIYENFRKEFFINNKVTAIINLAVVRDILFKNATSPGAVVIYKKRNDEITDYNNENILYCVPKSIETIECSQSIVIDASEIKFLPLREILKENSRVFKIAMWGNVRDLRLIEKMDRVLPLINKLNTNEHGMGLINDKGANKKGNPGLQRHLFIETKNIQSYYTRKDVSSYLGDKHQNYRTDKRNLYSPPLVLFKEGTLEDEVCSSFIDYPCAFQSSALGIKITNKNDLFHKALIACFNSTLGNYYFFLTSSNWKISKSGQIQKNEALHFPAIIYSFSEKSIFQLSSYVDQIIAIKSSNRIESDAEQRIITIQNNIDEIIYKELKLSANERYLIEDALNYSISLHKRYIASRAESGVTASKEMNTYAKTFLQSVNSVLKNNNKGAWIRILESNNNKVPLHIIAVHFHDEDKYGCVEIMPDSNISKLLKEINKHTYEKHSESIYYRKVVKYYKGKTIYLVKPNQKRFWSVSQALNDADNILLDLANQ